VSGLLKKSCFLFVLFLLLTAASAQEARPWWYVLERGKYLFRQGDYGSALLAFEDARRQRSDSYTGMERDLINFLSTPEVRGIGDSLSLLETYLVERRHTDVEKALGELYYRVPRESLQDSALRALEELGKFKDYPEAEYWIGEIYRVEGELGLALGQYQKARAQNTRLEDPNFELELLYKMADVYRLRQDYRRMEETLLEIVEGSNARGEAWDPLWLGEGGGNFMRDSMSRTLKNSGPTRFLIMYRYHNGPVEQAHRRLGLYYYASSRYDQAAEHLMFAFLIQNSILIEEVQRSRYDFVFESLENLMNSLPRGDDLLNYIDRVEYYRCTYYLGSSLYGIYSEASARTLWTFLSRREGQWRGRALAQLERPSLEAAVENP
jgi:tetratricopeptide (TPR) repeat protein